MAGNSHAKTCVLRVAKFEIMYYGNNVGQKSYNWLPYNEVAKKTIAFIIIKCLIVSVILPITIIYFALLI